MGSFSSVLNIDVRRLRVLRELDQHGTVTAAAAALHLTPSAVSQQLAGLARELGVPLIEKDGRGVRLTDAGQASALQGNRKRPKNDRLDARWLVMLLARDMLPGAWMAPEDIQRLRDRTRLRKLTAFPT